VRTALESIVDEGRRASRVIGRIRTMFKKTESEKTRVDINEIIRKILTFMDAGLQSQGVLVRAALTEEFPHLLVDRAQLQQVVLNLVMNAVEAMASVGTRDRVLKVTSEL
jgi:signal transduction histidine kinase